MEPRFRKRADGSLNLTDTAEAVAVKRSQQGQPWAPPMSPEAVLDKAKALLLQNHGDPANRKHLLGFFEIQFGVFRGQTFKWVLENTLGYAAYLVAAMKRDPTGGSKDWKAHSENKMCFKEYMEMFPSGRIAIAMKEEQYSEKGPQQRLPTQVDLKTDRAETAQPSLLHAAAPPQLPPSTKLPSISSLSSLLVGKQPQAKDITKAVKKLVTPSNIRPCKKIFILVMSQ